jgi:hypothetical protein
VERDFAHRREANLIISDGNCKKKSVAFSLHFVHIFQYSFLTLSGPKSSFLGEELNGHADFYFCLVFVGRQRLAGRKRL